MVFLMLKSNYDYCITKVNSEFLFGREMSHIINDIISSIASVNINLYQILVLTKILNFHTILNDSSYVTNIRLVGGKSIS